MEEQLEKSNKFDGKFISTYINSHKYMLIMLRLGYVGII